MSEEMEKFGEKAIWRTSSEYGESVGKNGRIRKRACECEMRRERQENGRTRKRACEYGTRKSVGKKGRTRKRACERGIRR